MRGSCTAAASAVIALALALPHSALAQALPSQIVIVVPFAAGGSTDAFARLIAPSLGEQLGSRIVIENRGGGSGSIGAKRVIQSAPDGATILLTTATLAVNDISQKKGFSNDELRAVALPVWSPDILTVHINNPARTLRELASNAKGKSLTMSSGGVGSTPWLVAEYYFKEIAKTPTLHVPFAGGGPAIAAAIGNHVDVFAGSVTTAAGPISQGQLRGLVVGSTARSPLAPDVPTFAEAGYPSFSPVNWIGFFVPAKASDALVERLNTAINAAMREPEVARRLAAAGFDTMIRSHHEAAATFKSDIAAWAKMSRAIGYQPD